MRASEESFTVICTHRQAGAPCRFNIHGLDRRRSDVLCGVDATWLLPYCRHRDTPPTSCPRAGADNATPGTWHVQMIRPGRVLPAPSRHYRVGCHLRRGGRQPPPMRRQCRVRCLGSGRRNDVRLLHPSWDFRHGTGWLHRAQSPGTGHCDGAARSPPKWHHPVQLSRCCVGMAASVRTQPRNGESAVLVGQSSHLETGDAQPDPPASWTDLGLCQRHLHPPRSGRLWLQKWQNHG